MNFETKKYYDENAQKYFNLNDSNETMKKFHNLFIDYISKGEIYDIGCGTGRDTEALGNLGLNVMGLDYSQEMLNVAKKYYPNSNFDKFDLLNDDYGKLKKVDGIWACASLLHFTKEEFKKVLTNLTLKLKSSGVVYLSLKEKKDIDNETINGRFFQYYEKKDLDLILENQGYLIKESLKTSNERDSFINYILLKNN